MFIDIAVNVTSEGMEDNLEKMVEACKLKRVMPIFCGLDIGSSKRCLELAHKYNTCCYLGIHPNHIKKEGMETDLNELMTNIKSLDFNNSRVIGIGECGLDYYRSSESDLQKMVFSAHNQIYNSYKLPFFYHCRHACKDFLEIAQHSGVVHSFDGTLEEAEAILKRGFYIGINGVSLKTPENIDVLKSLPLERILIETDSPFCLIRKSYAASSYTRVLKAKNNTPENVIQIAEVISSVKNVSIGEVERVTFENTLKVFPKIANFIEFWNK